MASTDQESTEASTRTASKQTNTNFDPYNPPLDLPSLTIHLETLLTLVMSHINTRDLPDSPLWSSIADDFTSRGMGYEAPSKQAFIDDYHDYAFRFPDHCLNITGMETSLNSRLTRGEVFVHVEFTGGHGVEKGRLSRKVVIVFEVRKEVGRWIVAGTTSLPGFGGEGGLGF